MLELYQQRYRKELLESVVPFWMDHGSDSDFGGFFSCLDREGRVYDSRKYVWIQGRTVWTFAKLYNDIEPRPEWLAAARSGAEFLRRHAFDSGGRCYFSLSREGAPVFFQRKPFAAVFVALGFLEYARASGEKVYQERAGELFWRIRSWIEFPGMLGRPVLGGEPPASHLGEVMVMAMMAIEFNARVHDRRYYREMVSALDGAMRHVDPDRGIFLEHVAPNGARRFDSPEGRLFNPGHSIEVAWLLLHLLRVHPDEERQRQVLDILEGSLEFGWDKEYGGLYYFMDVEGKPMLQLESEMKLWWPHTEAIYAVILAYTLTREQRWLDWLERLDEYTFQRFPDPEYGEWYGYLDRRGNLTNSSKGNNYKGIYHLARFLLYSVQAIAGARSGAGGEP